MAKLAETTEAMIGMDIFILNMEKLMRQEASLRTHFWKLFFFFVLSIRKQHKNDVISVAWIAVGGIVADQYTLNILEVEANTNSRCVA